jgi:hypothetical protein
MTEIIEGKEGEDTLIAFVMGYFTESPNEEGNQFSLHLAYSYDALNWIPLNQNNPVLIPNIGEKGMRDPFIYRKHDGEFVVLATNMWNSEFLICYDTPDLITFKNERLLRMNNTEMHAWAPEVFFDQTRDEYGIIWSGNTDRNRIYVNYTKEFKEVKDPEVYFDPGFNVIDASIEQYDGTFYLYYKDERDTSDAREDGMRIKGSRSNSLEPRSFDNHIFTDPIGVPKIEAPMIIKKLNENRWYLYGDSYYPINGKFCAWETEDLDSGNWNPISGRNYNTPLNVKHGSIVKIAQMELDSLIEYWGGTPGWNRLKSYSHPDQFIRIKKDTIELTAYPFDPFIESQWRIIPGLADNNGISFESLRYPDHYLTQSNFQLILQKDIGTSQFKEDATFIKVDGLADPSYSSFKSYTYQDRYIRHYEFQLILEKISSNIEKEAATFEICF